MILITDSVVNIVFFETLATEKSATDLAIIHRGTLAVLHRLVHDRELQLYDGTRLIRHDRYEDIRSKTGMSESELTSAGVLRIAPGFRIAALAEPPVIGGSSKGCHH